MGCLPVSDAGNLKILVFTSLFPNNIWTHHGVFIKERTTHTARLEDCQIKVVAPVPYFPPLRINRRWLFSQILRKEEIEGLEVSHPRYFMIPKVSMFLQGVMMFLTVLPHVRKVRQDFDFDVIDAHYVYPDGFAAVLLGMVLGKPVVVSARGTDINVYKEFRLIQRFLQFTLRRASRVISVSAALKQAMAGLCIPPDKIAVVSNGVDMNKFYSISKSEARQKLDLPEGKLLLSVGHLIEGKGFDLILKAFRIILDQQPGRKISLAIVGEGYFRRELESLIHSLRLGDCVRLTGDRPHSELKYWYNAADVFCLASSREGWPNVILESLACGTPVVATPVGGIPEILCSEEYGLLVARQEEEIARGLVHALDKPWKKHSILDYARQHNWQRVAHSVHSVFASAIRCPQWKLESGIRDPESPWPTEERSTEDPANQGSSS